MRCSPVGGHGNQQTAGTSGPGSEASITDSSNTQNRLNTQEEAEQKWVSPHVEEGVRSDLPHPHWGGLVRPG